MNGNIESCAFDEYSSLISRWAVEKVTRGHAGAIPFLSEWLDGYPALMLSRSRSIKRITDMGRKASFRMDFGFYAHTGIIRSASLVSEWMFEEWIRRNDGQEFGRMALLKEKKRMKAKK